SENATMTLPGIHPPTLNQIMDWICLLLDANFTVVVMMPEAKRLLINLYKLVKSQARTVFCLRPSQCQEKRVSEYLDHHLTDAPG
ncbi:NOL11 isoform 10, partial [Pan troglodytes]